MRVDQPLRSSLLVRWAAAACGSIGVLLASFVAIVAHGEPKADAKSALGTGLLVLAGALVGAAGARWHTQLTTERRVRALTGFAHALAAGDATGAPMPESSATDEVGELARALARAVARFRASADATRESHGQEREELQAHNREARLVLDHVDQGLLLLDRAGRVAGQHSAAVNRWFGPLASDAPFWESLERFDPRAATSFRLNWEQLLDGNIPSELAVDQLPRAFVAAGRVYELQYTPLPEGGVVQRMLVVVCDVTERRAAERAEAEQREVVRAFEYLMCDRRGFLEFFDEANAIVHRLSGEGRPPLVDVRRGLHTLKGNAAVFGMKDLASFCHALEDAMAETQSDLDEAQRAALRARWHAFASRIGALLGGSDEKNLAIEDVEYQALLRALFEGRPRRDIVRRVATWRLEPTNERLARHGAHARELAERLGKGTIDVTIAAGDLRLSRELMVPFWTAFAHAVRNAVAHGLEPPEERSAAGKSPVGSLRMRAWRDGERVTVEIADDGRGIDWEAVRVKARAAGLPTETRDDLCAALFHDGLSTADRVDGVSGRGVGMGALRAECEHLDGTVSVTSVPGAGTTLQFSFPADIVAENDETASALRVTIHPSMTPREARQSSIPPGSRPPVG